MIPRPISSSFRCRRRPAGSRFPLTRRGPVIPALLVLLVTAVEAAPAVQLPPPPLSERPSGELQRGALGLPYLERGALEAEVRLLSSDHFQGRLSGTDGYARAVRYAAERFQTMGLTPGGTTGTFVQPFRIEANEITGPVRLHLEYPDGPGVPYHFGRDYVARGFSGSGRVEKAPVMYVGWGLLDTDRGWDDYAGVDVRGKVLLMFMGAPPGTGDWGEKSRPRYKATVAAARGARAILFVDDPGPGVSSPIVSVYHGMEGNHQEQMPLLSIRNQVADDLLHGTPHSAASLRQDLAGDRRRHPLELPYPVSLEVQARYTSRAPTWNVVGWIEGSDPAVAHEYVVVGAHLDHVGTQAGVVFPGAQDNVSGSVMVMAMAEAMQRSPLPPRRSVCFVLFAAEELFLLGSEYFVQHPPRPIAQAVGMINLDMVGTGPRLRLQGGATTPAFQQMAVAADRLYGGFDLAQQDPTPARAGASDHTAFVNAGVPTLYFSSGGAPGRAHTAEDTADTIDYEAYRRTARVVYLTLFQMADRR